MCSSASVSPSLLPTDVRFLFHRCHFSLLNSSQSVLTNRRPRSRRLSLSASVAERNLEVVSWFPPESNAVDDYGGWAIVDAPTPKKKKKGFPPIVLIGFGTSVAALLAIVSCISLSRRGFRFQFSNPLNAIHGMLVPSGTDEAIDATSENTKVPETSSDNGSNAVTETVTSETKPAERMERKLERVLVPAYVDSTQQDAILMLKKLKIIEDDVKADELCSRREYARWLIRVYSLLERNPKHRIHPSVALSGTIVAAFRDVSIEDPDFWSIQSLAEVGIIPSKLSSKNSTSDVDDSKGQEGVKFFPDRWLSRQDLVSWKAQIEYEPALVTNEKISRTDVSFMDMRDISSNAPPEFFMDILAGDKSIIREVFGQLKRFQPNKPSTKAQAAVALTSGSIRDSIEAELSRIEAENSSRQIAMEEIRCELLEREDVRRYWDGKLAEEKRRGSEVEKDYLAAVYDLEQEKTVQENSLSDFMKEKATIDCQKQLLHSLKEEVSEMSERLACERIKHMEEQRYVQDMLSDLQVKQEGILDAKSILEAEVEAVRILRSWIEDEARKSQARAKFLEEVGRRWKWDE